MDSADFRAFPQQKELKFSIPDDSCNLELPFISDSQVSSNSVESSGFGFDPTVSVEYLDFLRAQLDFSGNDNVNATQAIDFLRNENVGFDGVLEFNSITQNTVQKLHSPETDIELQKAKVSGEVMDLEVPTVSIEIIQNKRPFECSETGCDKTFRNLQTLRLHYRTHFTNESLISRQWPDNSVSQASKAGNNKKVPCRCPVCGRTCVGLYELRRHFGRKHSEGEKLHNCRKCEKKFYVEIDLKDHEKLCGERVECKCGLKFAFKCNLSAHRRNHPECAEDHSVKT